MEGYKFEIGELVEYYSKIVRKYLVGKVVQRHRRVVGNNYCEYLICFDIDGESINGWHGENFLNKYTPHKLKFNKTLD